MKITITCGLCDGRGKLWLGGDDYVECPDCLAKGTVVMNEYKVRKVERTIFLPGMMGFRTLTNRLVNWR